MFSDFGGSDQTNSIVLCIIMHGPSSLHDNVLFFGERHHWVRSYIHAHLSNFRVFLFYFLIEKTFTGFIYILKF